MRSVRSMLSACLGALALCMGSFAYASEALPQAMYFAVATMGAYGAEYAQFEQTVHQQTASVGQVPSMSVGNLLVQSHGFVQASVGEVAKGTVGSNLGYNPA
jgi:hypothetical protein